jgi:Uma2 family endonuclease
MTTTTAPPVEAPDPAVLAGLAEFDHLPAEDGIPLESYWHRLAMGLLIETLSWHWRGRSDVFIGGNMFIYFSRQQVRNRDYRGPDFFCVKEVVGGRDRPYWAVWDEGGRYPNVIVELMSPSTRDEDLVTKKDLYERVFRTPDYFCYDPASQRFYGWRLNGGLRYQPLQPNEHGRLWSEELGLWLGTWHGEYLRQTYLYPRWYDAEGVMVPTYGEGEQRRADQAEERAGQAEKRADQAETQLQRLKLWLAQQGLNLPGGNGT